MLLPAEMHIAQCTEQYSTFDHSAFAVDKARERALLSLGDTKEGTGLRFHSSAREGSRLSSLMQGSAQRNLCSTLGLVFTDFNVQHVCGQNSGHSIVCPVALRFYADEGPTKRQHQSLSQR